MFTVSLLYYTTRRPRKEFFDQMFVFVCVWKALELRLITLLTVIRARRPRDSVFNVLIFSIFKLLSCSLHILSMLSVVVVA